MSDPRLDYAQLLLGEAREELGRADNKISALLATAGVGVSVVAGAIAIGSWTPARLITWAQGMWWSGVIVAFAGIVALASALAPRVRSGEGKPAVHYFGHAARFNSPHELGDALSRVSCQTLERTISQLWIVSRIVILKYKRIRFALIAFAAAALLLIVAASVG